MILPVILFLDGQIREISRAIPQPTTGSAVEDVRYLLEAFGFEEKRSKGSHHSFRDSQGRKITIPKKGGQKVKGIYVQQIVELLNWKNGAMKTLNQKNKQIEKPPLEYYLNLQYPVTLYAASRGDMWLRLKICLDV
jgi:predicted RNA binding protein YcfA (HicA-like mRNA interferase family)